MNTSNARITAIGSYVPSTILTNNDLEKMVETDDEWIIQRTGIKERRIAAENEFTSDLCVKAVENLAKQFNKTIEDVDFIIVCTMTPDFKTPSVAAHVQGQLGIHSAGAIDINAACAGFTYGLQLASSMITSRMYKKILVIGAETLSKITDFTDRTTCILFGDGASCVLVEYEEQQTSFLSFHSVTEGENAIHLYASHLSNTMLDTPLLGDGHILQNGREVYKWAVKTVPKGMQALLEKANLTFSDIDWFIPHSANLRMIESICAKSGFPMEQTLYSLVQYGNTSAATIPLSLSLAYEEKKLKNGDTLLLYGFGGGLTQAGVIVKWMI